MDTLAVGAAQATATAAVNALREELTKEIQALKERVAALEEKKYQGLTGTFDKPGTFTAPKG